MATVQIRKPTAAVMRAPDGRFSREGTAETFKRPVRLSRGSPDKLSLSELRAQIEKDPFG